MSDINIIKELREQTGLSFKEINKALEEAGGDKAGAIELLKKLGAQIAEKKASRTTSQGIVSSYVHNTNRIGAIVEVLCETDFVGRNPIFSELGRELAMHIAAMDPRSVEELLEQLYIKDASLTVKAFIEQYIAKLGENIKVGKFARLQI
jgi:elongation factor Ts